MNAKLHALVTLHERQKQKKQTRERRGGKIYTVFRIQGTKQTVAINISATRAELLKRGRRSRFPPVWPVIKNSECICKRLLQKLKSVCDPVRSLNTSRLLHLIGFHNLRVSKRRSDSAKRSSVNDLKTLQLCTFLNFQHRQKTLWWNNYRSGRWGTLTFDSCYGWGGKWTNRPFKPSFLLFCLIGGLWKQRWSDCFSQVAQNFRTTFHFADVCVQRCVQIFQVLIRPR